MESSKNDWMSTAIFEHGCKHNFSTLIKNALLEENFVSKIIQHSGDEKIQKEEELKIKPIFLLIFLLKKLHSVHNIETLASDSSDLSILSFIIQLLESTYKQYNFMPLKKFFTFIAELKLLDLLKLITTDSESTIVMQNLNHHFPRWTPVYKAAMQKEYSVENSKILDKVQDSHAQCRRLILKLAVDKAYRSKYLSEEYSNDLSRLSRESKEFISESILSLESNAGSTVLEKILSVDESNPQHKDAEIQLLLDYIQPEITEENLLRFLEDVAPILNSQPATCLTSCLLPMDTDSDEDSSSSESDYESSEDVGNPNQSSIATSGNPKDVEMNSDKEN